MVDEKDNVFFFDDVYGFDKRLDEALNKRTRTRQRRTIGGLFTTWTPVIEKGGKWERTRTESVESETR